MTGKQLKARKTYITGPESRLPNKLPGVGETIFSTMNKLAFESGALNLAQGFPDFSPPDKLLNKAFEYMQKGYNQYAPMPGIKSLRQKISSKVKKYYNADYDWDNEILVTPGATHAIYTSISAIVKEAEEVIILEPAYDIYAPAVLLNGGIPKYVPLTYPDYEIDWIEVKRNISFHTKMIIINNPHNPTGRLLKENDFKELEKIARNYDIFIMSDEVYEHIVFDENKFISLSSLTSIKDRTITISSFGKTYNITGWKMGYVLASESIMKEIRKVYQYNMFSAATPFQHALVDCIDDDDWIDDLKSIYTEKRNRFMKSLRASRFKILNCDASFFICLDYSDISKKGDFEFAKFLTMEKKVASIPVSTFYHKQQDHKVLRFCFAKDDQTLDKAAEILCDL